MRVFNAEVLVSRAVAGAAFDGHVGGELGEALERADRCVVAVAFHVAVVADGLHDHRTGGRRGCAAGAC